jgi:hypothetical protein
LAIRITCPGECFVVLDERVSLDVNCSVQF